jgi:hypothetical protein
MIKLLACRNELLTCFDLKALQLSIQLSVTAQMMILPITNHQMRLIFDVHICHIADLMIRAISSILMSAIFRDS